MQIAVLADDVGAGSQPEMEGVTQNNLSTNGLDIARQHTLYGAVGAHGHEGGRLYNTALKL